MYIELLPSAWLNERPNPSSSVFWLANLLSFWTSMTACMRTTRTRPYNIKTSFLKSNVKISFYIDFLFRGLVHQRYLPTSRRVSMVFCLSHQILPRLVWNKTSDMFFINVTRYVLLICIKVMCSERYISKSFINFNPINR